MRPKVAMNAPRPLPKPPRALTVVRSLTGTFAEIAPRRALFIVSQLLGVGCAALGARWLFDPLKKRAPGLCDRTPSLTALLYLPSGQSGQGQQQSATAFATAGAAAIAAVLADSSRTAAITFFM